MQQVNRQSKKQPRLRVRSRYLLPVGEKSSEEVNALASNLAYFVKADGRTERITEDLARDGLGGNRLRRHPDKQFVLVCDWRF